MSNRNRQEHSDVPASKTRGNNSGVNRNINHFLQSLGDTLIDFTALEVNTIVVDHISGHKFIAWEAYRDIYPISPDYLELQGIHESLRDRYLELRTSLEREYRGLLNDPTSELHDPTVYEQDNSSFANDFERTPTRLPNPLDLKSPETIVAIQRLLGNCRFLRGLRKLAELKAALDDRNQTVLRLVSQQPDQVEMIQRTIATDTICAQTVIQLDGDVINRYDQSLFHHPQKEMILQIHREGVIASERQWRGLLEFIIGLIKATLHKS